MGGLLSGAPSAVSFHSWAEPLLCPYLPSGAGVRSGTLGSSPGLAVRRLLTQVCARPSGSSPLLAVEAHHWDRKPVAEETGLSTSPRLSGGAHGHLFLVARRVSLHYGNFPSSRADWELPVLCLNAPQTHGPGEGVLEPEAATGQEPPSEG